MTKLIERLCGCDPDRASRLQFVFKVWVAYLGLVFLGGAIFSAALYVWFDRHVIEVRGQYQVENQRMQDINRQLLLIIEKRLPAIAEKAGEAAETAATAAATAQSAAATAHGAAKTAGKAGGVAQAASTKAAKAAATVQGAASDLTDALNPPAQPAVEAPDWLGGS